MGLLPVMKLILFNPPAPDGRGFTREGRCTQEAGVWASQWPPVTLATAAAFLAGDGHEVHGVDFPALGLPVRDLEARIAALRPDAALWTTGTPTLAHDLYIATLVKAASPETLTGVMGTHVSVMPGEVLENSDVDVVIRGEPEGIIRELCRRGNGEGRITRTPGAIAGISHEAGGGGPITLNPEGGGGASASNNRGEGESSAPDRAGVVGTAGGGVRGGIGGGGSGGGRRERWRLSDVVGISYKDAAGAVIHNPDAGWLPPEEIPAPAWEHFDLAPYRLPLSGRPFLIVAPVRGCPYACSFCTAPVYYGRKLRKRPVANVIAEIKDNIRRFGVTEFFIWADTFTADRKYVRSFCAGILEAGLRITWTCNSRVDTIDGETLALMKKAGLWMISFGLESGDDDILAASGKRITTADSRRAVRLARAAGVRTAGHFILGLPGETEATMAATLRLASELPLNIAQFYAAAPFPGTRLYEEATAKGWLKTGGGIRLAGAYGNTWGNAVNEAADSSSAHEGESTAPPGPRKDVSTAEAEADQDKADGEGNAIQKAPDASYAHDGEPMTPPGHPAGAGTSQGQFSPFSQNSAVLELPGLSAATVDAFRRRSYRAFYRRPKIIAGLLAMVEPGAAVHLTAAARRFLKWSR